MSLGDLIYEVRHRAVSLWYQYIFPLGFLIKCPECGGRGGHSPPDGCPGGEWSECHMCYDQWSNITDHFGPDWVVGRLPFWKFRMWLAWNILEGQHKISWALKCRLGFHSYDYGDSRIQICGRCYESKHCH